MGKALIAVATFLAICFLILGGVVYFTREEDTYAVDNVLSERITRAVAEERRVDLRTLTRFDFDRVLIFEPGTPRADISRELGFEFKGELRYTAESSEIFVFTNNGAFVRFADYRGPDRFAGLERPFTSLDANDAVFRIREGVVSRLP